MWWKSLYLKESLKPPNLEETLSDEEDELEQTPPFNTRVCAFGGVAVHSFSEDDVGLFVADLFKRLR